MNFDRSSHATNISPAEADWGIEETSHHRKRFDSVSTGDFPQPPRIREYSSRSSVVRTGSGSFGAGSDIYHTRAASSDDNFRLRKDSQASRLESIYGRERLHVLSATTENFGKYIYKYLRIYPSRESMVEEFKYNLVLSNLLDDSLVLSKNEQALDNLLRTRKVKDSISPPRVLKKELGFDGMRLQIVKRQYSLISPSNSQLSALLLNIIGLTIFLIKRIKNINSHITHTSCVKLFKILLIFATQILKCKRAQAAIEYSESTKNLDDFMIANCRINKAMISHMILLKELDIFSFLSKPAESSSFSGSRVSSSALKKHLDTMFTCSILNIKYSIRELLPFSHGELLEQYCHINNIRVSAIHENSETEQEESITSQTLTTKLSLFNNHRRFFVCQLLTVHKKPLQNFFISTISHHLRLVLPPSSKLDIQSNRARMLAQVLKAHTSTLDQLLQMDEKFTKLQGPFKSTDYANADVLSTHNVSAKSRGLENILECNSETNLDNLIDKLSGVVNSLKYFKKYSQSIDTLDDADEHEEKLSIFGSLHGELQTGLDLFGSCMGEYRANFNTKFNPFPSGSSSRSNSQRNSHNSDDTFNPKLFRTSTSRFKKQAIQSTSEEIPLSEDLSGAGIKGDKRSKRASSGLQLGLVTVLEDPSQFRADSKTESRSNSGSNHGSFNSTAFDSLTKKRVSGYQANRFSMASVNSNLSGITDLIASTQITTDEDDGETSKNQNFLEGATRGMSKFELEKKLEESLTRIYNLETENQELQDHQVRSVEAQENVHNENIHQCSSATVDPTFLTDLEATLNAKGSSPRVPE